MVGKKSTKMEADFKAKNSHKLFKTMQEVKSK